MVTFTMRPFILRLRLTFSSALHQFFLSLENRHFFLFHPVHYALSNGANHAIVDCILKQRPNSARGFDKRGWTPLHVACGVGADMYVIKAIVECYPEAVLMRTNKGSTAKQCLGLTNAPNKAEVKRLLQSAYSKVEKRYRPAQEIKSERVLV